MRSEHMFSLELRANKSGLSLVVFLPRRILCYSFFVCAPMVSYAFVLSLFIISSSFVVLGRPYLVIVAFHWYFYKFLLCKAPLHYENMSIQIYRNFYLQKLKIFG